MSKRQLFSFTGDVKSLFPCSGILFEKVVCKHKASVLQPHGGKHRQGVGLRCPLWRFQGRAGNSARAGTSRILSLALLLGKDRRIFLESSL